MRLLAWSRRHLLLLLLAAGVTAATAAVFAIVFLGPIGVRHDPRCEDLSESGCGAFLQALFGEVEGDVEAVHAVMDCGEDECPILFGADLARFAVVYRDGSQEEFLCWQRIGEASCDRLGTK